ncbi:hypothetical protein P9239_01375 [Caballeronia sp. LZ062]|uniref:hypothetical protein n=1 Tax=unclassified Caballeronia TaxID=2646786 RepID=UPI0028670C56|nr:MULTISPECIES: hypothetical protein [unclassified Caballeronia]MDR5857458.1 hypothetical protein [Caballeronia sp. LZ050]MDR5869009.1 hypothetical protein [Caballeronia sp. LZ062]
MKTLTIHDLPLTEQLDRRAMSAVRGGTSFYFPGYDVSKVELSFDTQQFIGQTQNTKNQNGVGVAFGGNITSKVEPKQEASNTSTINIGSGFLPR